MKRFRQIVALLVVAFLITIAFNVNGQSTRQEESNLAAENARLRARVRELEERVQKLEDERRTFNGRLPAQLFDRTQPFELNVPEKLPPGSRTHEYNVITYF